MKAPKNFYNNLDQKKVGIDELFTRMSENENDIAAIEEVIENLPTITPVEANPDEPITGILNSVKIGDTNYRVRDDAKITTIKKLNILLTGSNDGYNIALGKVVIYNSITGEYYTFIDGTDTITCDKPYHDSNINNCLYGNPGTDCRVYKNQGSPTFTITFGNDLNIERYDTLAIYSTNPVSMCANNVKVAISPDGKSFIDTIDKNMTWLNSTATPNEIGKIYEITDPVIDAIITQIGTIEDDVSDLETVVGDNTSGLVKDVSDIENDIDGHLLADVTSADEGKIMSVDSTGAWALVKPATELNVFKGTISPLIPASASSVITFDKLVSEIVEDYFNSNRAPTFLLITYNSGSYTIQYRFEVNEDYKPNQGTGNEISIQANVVSGAHYYHVTALLSDSNNTNQVTCTRIELT